jgi:transcriptional regulator with XRE-family HTH domain
MEDARTPRCGRLVRAARRRHGLNQQALAERTGTTQTAISRIERDLVSPSLTTLDRILGAMGETIAVAPLSLDRSPPGGGNTSIRELRADYEQLSSDERLRQAAELSEIQSELAASGPIR